MFNFHKPKVYRSTQGCCICRAKSSSSRFTDSKKYEEAFEPCFELKEKRTGEVCNACVLLVKRWRNLPENSERNWKHVVDARAGPGTRTLSKVKSSKNKKKKIKEKLTNGDEVMKMEVDPSITSLGLKDLDGNDCESPSPTPSEEAYPLKHSRLNGKPSGIPVSDFIDMSVWKKVKVCCGTIFEGPCGAVMIDPRFMTPCSKRHRPSEMTPVATKVEELPVAPAVMPRPETVVDKHIAAADPGKVFNDASSDSGYDESSQE